MLRSGFVTYIVLLVPIAATQSQKNALMFNSSLILNHDCRTRYPYCGGSPDCTHRVVWSTRASTLWCDQSRRKKASGSIGQMNPAIATAEMALTAIHNAAAKFCVRNYRDLSTAKRLTNTPCFGRRSCCRRRRVSKELTILLCEIREGACRRLPKLFRY